MRRRKSKMKNLDKYCVLCLTEMIVFTIVTVVFQFVTGQELSSTLIAANHAAFGGELFQLAMIKKYKLKKGEEDDGFLSNKLGADFDSSSYSSRAD